MASRSRRRAGGIAVAGAAGLVGVSVAGVPVLPAAGVAGLVSLGTRGAMRELRERLDPVDAVAQLRITRDGELLGSYRRRDGIARAGVCLASEQKCRGSVSGSTLPGPTTCTSRAHRGRGPGGGAVCRGGCGSGR